MHHEQDEPERTVDRRKLLRRAGTVAAGVAGAGVVAAVAADPAAAAPGDPVLLGQVNEIEAGLSVRTNLTTDHPSLPALELTNNALVGDLSGPALRLTPSAPLIDGVPIGSISADAAGTLWSSVDFGGDPGLAFVYSTAVANITVPLSTPVRVLDTRPGVPAPGQANIINPTGNLDSAGRLLGGHTIHIDLRDYVFAGLGLLGNITVLKPAAQGFLTVYPYGTDLPSTSNISFAANANVSNFTTTAIGFDAADLDPLDAISIYSSSTAFIILDVMAFIVQSYDQVAGSAAVSGASVAAAAPDQRAKAQIARQKRAVAKIHQLRAQQ